MSGPSDTPIRYPQAAGYKDEGPGRDAARRVGSQLGRRRSEALDAFRRLGVATPDEVAELVGRPAHIVRPRVSELFLLGEPQKTEKRGRSSYGSPQTIYRLSTPEERALFAAQRAAQRSTTEDRQ